MERITLKQINTIANMQPENEYEQKREAIAAYEDLQAVNVVDSAYPMSWADSIRKRLGVRNIGEWGWAYGDEFTFGIPVPCDPRAFAYFETLFSRQIIGQHAYKNDRQTAYIATDES